LLLLLSLIYNKSLSEGVVPQEWKRKNITARFTKGSQSDPGNYRPVSLTSYLGKMLEATLKDRTEQDLTDNSLLNDSQHQRDHV